MQFAFGRHCALGKSSASALATEEPESSCSSLFNAEAFAVCLKEEVVSRSLHRIQLCSLCERRALTVLVDLFLLPSVRKRQVSQ